MEIKFFEKDNISFVHAAADILADNFPHAYEDCALEEMEECLKEERIALMAVEDGQLLGFVGAILQYDYAWELHPLVVRKSSQLRGIGTELVHALEKECAARGAFTLYLGTDDEFGQTSLGNTDLYEDTCGKMQDVKNLKRHPFEFYQKLGYRIVGVIPDANGPGKPDIFMAKRIGTAGKI
ncbi:MAG: GNAT family N-acetyltransferase [Lachnospiraceae bacterium]|nr:GNAT family N-acetyltransferase [Lachnospiraceae bacterium]